MSGGVDWGHSSALGSLVSGNQARNSSTLEIYHSIYSWSYISIRFCNRLLHTK